LSEEDLEDEKALAEAGLEDYLRGILKEETKET